MNFCHECLATNCDARKAVEMIPTVTNRDGTDADKLANFLNIEVEDAQIALNCWYKREFEDCSPQDVYNNN